MVSTRRFCYELFPPPKSCSRPLYSEFKRDQLPTLLFVMNKKNPRPTVPLPALVGRQCSRRLGSKRNQPQRLVGSNKNLTSVSQSRRHPVLEIIVRENPIAPVRSIPCERPQPCIGVDQGMTLAVPMCTVPAPAARVVLTGEAGMERTLTCPTWCNARDAGTESASARTAAHSAGSLFTCPCWGGREPPRGRSGSSCSRS